MGKRRQTLRVRIPPYFHPRNEWRRAIHAELIKAVSVDDVVYANTDTLELVITLYIPKSKIGWHDVDNRLKDIMDALQGRAGGAKSKHSLSAIVPNDHQIHKVTIEKRTPPQQSCGMGHLIIRKYREAAGTNRQRTHERLIT
jgi:hypothetical protein